MTQEAKKYQAQDLKAFLATAFKALDVPSADAEEVAHLMAQADLLGYDTHGSFRLRQYVNRLRDGGNNPQPNIQVVSENAATAIVDGDNGLGHLAMNRAVDVAIEKARQSGIGWVGVRNGNHAGPASLYVNRIAEADMIGLMAAVGSANHVAPFGGLELLLGTNPLAIAVPAGSSAPFVLDMATTAAAAGKIKVLAQRGDPMPEGWMVDRKGNPLTDPARQSEGLLLPIGGAKGYGLAMAIGLLAGTLNGCCLRQGCGEFHQGNGHRDQHRTVCGRDLDLRFPATWRPSRPPPTEFSKKCAVPIRCPATNRFEFRVRNGRPTLAERQADGHTAASQSGKGAC